MEYPWTTPSFFELGGLSSVGLIAVVEDEQPGIADWKLF